jgi:hypothetical protein
MVGRFEGLGDLEWRLFADVARGRKGKGILIHSRTEGNGMPLANRITPANGGRAGTSAAVA